MDRMVGVVTGAGGDIGREVALELVRRGAGVLCVDADEATLDKTVSALKQAGGMVEMAVADVSKEGDVFSYADLCREKWGAANFFFNNAGIEGAEAPLSSYPIEAWDKVLSVNLRGVFLGLKAMLPLLRHADTPRIVNTASVAGMLGTPMLAAYGASKHAVIGLTKTAAIEFAPYGIAVNALCPGPVDSKMMRRIEQGIAPEGGAAAAKAGYERNIPQNRYAQLDEIADVAAYLLLESPIYLTGQAIAVDGGMVVA